MINQKFRELDCIPKPHCCHGMPLAANALWQRA
jgi:hypothetical protein